MYQTMPESLQLKIEEKLKIAFKPSLLMLTDETHKHLKHRHFQSGKYHLKLEIQSNLLSKLSKLKAHQAIYRVLERFMQGNIHALSITLINDK